MRTYLIKRINITCNRDVTIIGKRSMCGANAIPFENRTTAESALKRQAEQDRELCPDFIIEYKIIETE